MSLDRLCNKKFPFTPLCDEIALGLRSIDRRGEKGRERKNVIVYVQSNEWPMADVKSFLLVLDLGSDFIVDLDVDFDIDFDVGTEFLSKPDVAKSANLGDCGLCFSNISFLDFTTNSDFTSDAQESSNLILTSPNYPFSPRLAIFIALRRVDDVECNWLPNTGRAAIASNWKTPLGPATFYAAWLFGFRKKILIVLISRCGQLRALLTFVDLVDFPRLWRHQT